eukprot:7540277-Pyramimonas_sp.AAC.1
MQKRNKASWTNCKHCGAPNDQQFPCPSPRPGLPAPADAAPHGADGAGGGPRLRRAPGRVGVAPEIGLGNLEQATNLMG